MGGKKAKLQNQAQTRSAQSVEEERAGASALNEELKKRREIVGQGLPETIQATNTGAQNLRTTGGVVPMNIDTTGRGYEGYQELSKTGGFTPGESEQFLRRATAPTTAVYSNIKDNISRRAALQGGYSSGFDAATAKATRQGANAGSEAALTGTLELNKQIREGKTAGLAGMERVKAQAEQERLAKQGQMQTGQIAGQEALNKASQLGIAALNEVDINELRNRVQSGNVSQADSQLLTMLAAQNKTLFDQIMQGVSAVGGATAGILTGVGAL